MSFPSQLPPSPVARTIRWAAALTGLVMLIASILGIVFALTPAAGTGPDAMAADTALAQTRQPDNAHANGKIPMDQLVQVRPGRFLIPEAASAFTVLSQAMARAGHAVQVNSAYRTLAEQEGLVKRHGLLADGGTAAPVGTSEHGLGISVDMTLDGAALDWMFSNAGAFGFSNTVAGEPWHWTYTNAG